MGRIAIFADNSSAYISTLLMIWNSNNSAVLIDKRIPMNKVIDILKVANVDGIYTDDEKIIIEIQKKCNIFYNIIKMSRPQEEYVVPDILYEEYNIRFDKEEALVIFSSGTTGSNKGIILSHKSITENAIQSIIHKKMTEKSRIYIYKSLAHSSSIVNECLASLICRANMVIASTYCPIRKHFKNIEDYKITIFGLNPQILNLLLKQTKYNFSALELIVCSGSILLDFIQDMAIKELDIKVINAYGLTETGPMLTIQDPCEKIVLGSVGKAIDGVSIKICHNGKTLMPLMVGTIFVKTEMHMIGYLNCEKLDPDVWINTHDIGYKDLEGNLFVLGREDNMIITGTHNVFPETIEKLILTLEEVNECLIKGVDSSTYGQEIVCECVINGNPEIVKHKIFEICKKNLASFEVPHRIYFVNNIKHTYSGKIKRMGNKYENNSE